jgi:TP901 family phage tail tape measure protein
LVSGGSNGVDFAVRLNTDSLARDVVSIRDKFKNAKFETEVKVLTDKAQGELNRLTSSINSAKASLAKNTDQEESLKRTAALFQENLRFKQQLAAIDKAGFSDAETNKLKAFAAELNRLNSQKVDVKLQIDADNQLAKFETQFSRLQSQLANSKVSFAASSGAGNVAELQREAQLLQEQIRFKQQLKSLESAGFNAAQVSQARALATEINRINLARIESEFQKAKSSAGSFFTSVQAGFKNFSDNIVTGIGQGIGQGVVNVAQGIASGAASFIGSSVQTFASFEGAIKSIGIKSDSLGTPELADLRKEIERLGLTTSKTPIDIARMTTSLAQAGFSATESKEAIEGIIKASEATGESLGTVGDIIGKTLRTFDLGTKQSLDVANLLTTGANATNTSISSLGEALAYVGPAAANAKQPLDDTIVLLGLLGDKGIQGSRAGTNLGEVLSRLKIASAATTSEIKELVKGSARAAQAFQLIGVAARNPDGSMKSLLEILPKIKQSLNGLEQVDQDILAKALFGVEGGRAFQALVDTSSERVDLVSNKVKVLSREGVGAARKAGEEMLQGLDGAIVLLTSSIEVFKGKIGEGLAPAFEGAARGATEVLNNLIENESLLGTLKQSATEFGDALKDPELTQELTAQLTEVVRLLADDATNAVKTFTAYMKQNPRALSEIVQGIGAMIKGLGQAIGLAAKLVQTLEEGRQRLKGLINPGAGDKEGSQNALRGAGATQAQIDAVEKRVKDRIEKQTRNAINPFFRGERLPNEQIRAQETQAEVARIAAERRKNSGTLTDAKNTFSPELARAKQPPPKTRRFAAADADDAEARGEAAPTSKRKLVIPKTDKEVERDRKKQEREQSAAARKAESEEKKQQREAIAAARKAAEEKRKAQEEALANVRQANQRTELAIEGDTQKRIGNTKVLLLNQRIDQEEASKRIADIEVSSSVKIFAAKRQELDQVKALRATGKIDAKKGTDEELKLIREIGKADMAVTDARIKAQEALRRVKLKALEEEFNARKSPLQNQVETINLRVTGQQELANAQQTLAENLNRLTEQRLQYQKEDAEAAGNKALADQLGLQILRQQGLALEAQLASKRESLRLGQLEKQDRLQTQLIQSKIAELDAEETVRKAEVEGRSKAEIDRLQKIVDLRKQAIGVSESEIANSKKIYDLQVQSLNVEAQTSREAKQREIQKFQQQQQTGALAGQTGAGGVSQNTSPAVTGGVFYGNVVQSGGGASPIAPPIIPPSPPPAPISPADASVANTRSQIFSTVDTKLDRLTNALEKSSNGLTTLNVTTPEPARDAVKIFNEVSSGKLAGMGV